MQRLHLLILFIVLLWGECLFASEEFIIARVNEWPPFYFQQNGDWKGTNIDYYEALTKEAGVKMEIKVIPWSRAMIEMKSKPILIGQLVPTEERKKTMYFIGPHSKEQMIFGINKKYLNNDIKNLDDLVSFSRKVGKQIAYQQDVFYSKEFNDRIKSDSNFSEHFYKKARYYTVIRMLENERIAGFLEEKTVLIYKLKYEQRSEIVVIHPFVLNSTDVYFGLSKTVSNNTLNKLREANDRLIADGIYAEIMKKWSD